MLTTIRFGVLEDLERALSAHGQNVATFLVEPIQGESGWWIIFTVHGMCIYLAATMILPY